MSFGFDGAHGTDIRPAHVAAVKAWAKDASAPDANDGTRLTASLLNMLVGNLRAAAARNGISTPEGSDDIVADMIDAAVARVGGALFTATPYVSTMPPTASDDAANTSGRGVFKIGSRWIDTEADESYVCTDATATAAVWVQQTLVAAELGALAFLNAAAIADVTGLQAALDAKAPLDSPPLTGTPTAPTPDGGATGSEIANAAWVLARIAASGVASFNGRTGAVAPAAGDYATADITGLAAALALLAPLADPTFTGTLAAPTVNASTAYQKKGVAAELILKRVMETWTTGFTSTSLTAVDAWTSGEITKEAATGDASKAHISVSAAATASRGGHTCGVALSCEVRTHDGSSWGSWTPLPGQSIYTYAGGVANTQINGSVGWEHELDLTGKTKWQVKITGYNISGTGSPSFTLSNVMLRALEIF